MDISYRGRLNKYFTGLGRYTWSHYESHTDGIGWFPENQFDPDAEWSNASACASSFSAGWSHNHSTSNTRFVTQEL